MSGMIFLNDEDMDITAIVGSWLSKQSESHNLESWIEDYFYKALNWFVLSFFFNFLMSPLKLQLEFTSLLRKSKPLTPVLFPNNASRLSVPALILTYYKTKLRIYYLSTNPLRIITSTWKGLLLVVGVACAA